MTKKQIQQLENIMIQLMRGQTYLMREDILVCGRKSYKSTTLDFTNDQGEVCTSFNKEIGSELALLHNGIRNLHNLITYEKNKRTGAPVCTSTEE